MKRINIIIHLFSLAVYGQIKQYRFHRSQYAYSNATSKKQVESNEHKKKPIKTLPKGAQIISQFQSSIDLQAANLPAPKQLEKN
ncbi:hypothetical protein AB6A40_007456 [Gnathostoma spinigerum]|uniref:Uncharacterized protein n=1 Tax=Gnathostoma spinigerum TaxID=75299 RepID=A0ABD6EVN8_9BILA